MGARAMINGRWVEMPEVTTDDHIRQVAAIAPGRMLIRRTRQGNYVVPQRSQVRVEEGDQFADAPARIKGNR
jgi:hypothetical protein